MGNSLQTKGQVLRVIDKYLAHYRPKPARCSSCHLEFAHWLPGSQSALCPECRDYERARERGRRRHER